MGSEPWSPKLSLGNTSPLCTCTANVNTCCDDSHHYRDEENLARMLVDETGNEIIGQVDVEAVMTSREKRVRSIQRDVTLSDSEKQERIHQVMCSGYHRQQRPRKRPRTMMITSSLDEEENVGVDVIGNVQKWWHDEQRGILGCKHYARKCRILATCCGEYVGCRLCHDEIMEGDHKIDRTKTRQVLCMVCGKPGVNAGKCCENCGVEFAEYYCGECKFWTSGEKAQQVYHCEGCGLCRMGKGLCLHCDKCGVCVPSDKFDMHPCVEKMVDRCCPICTEYLAASTEPVIQLRHCGHVIHSKCLLQHWKLRYTCPVCMKAIIDMKAAYQLLDQMMKKELENIPKEYTNWMSKVYCQDCYHTSTVSYHFAHHRCAHCASYNTRVDHVYKNEPPLSGNDQAPIMSSGNGKVHSIEDPVLATTNIENRCK